MEISGKKTFPFVHCQWVGISYKSCRALSEVKLSDKWLLDFLDFLRWRPAILKIFSRASFSFANAPWICPLKGIILGMGSANERRRYIVTPPLIDRAHTQNDPWLTSCLSISTSLGELTKIVFCMSPTKHQYASASCCTSANTGASRSDMPWV